MVQETLTLSNGLHKFLHGPKLYVCVTVTALAMCLITTSGRSILIMCSDKTCTDTRPESLPRCHKRGRDCLTLVWNYELPCILSAELLFLASWLFAATGNLPNDLNVRRHLTPLFIKRNWEQKGRLSCTPKTTYVCQERAMERELYKAYSAQFSASQ